LRLVYQNQNFPLANLQNILYFSIVKFTNRERVMKKCLSLILIVSILIYSYGCYSYKVEKKEKLNSDHEIVWVVLIDGNMIVFDSLGGRYDEVSMQIYGVSENNNFIQIAKDDVLYVNVIVMDKSLILTLALVVLSLFGLIIWVGTSFSN
jgi:hypothetical protein